jgi:uncharacterized SAM-dependent methyltransferase
MKLFYVGAQSFLTGLHITPAPYEAAFLSDMVDLLTGKRQGHMERWEYASAHYPGDPAAGGEHWADLVRNPGHYYLTEGDQHTITQAIEDSSLRNLVADIESVVELGPGSRAAIEKKTIPFLKSCAALKNYTAVDATVEQADAACQFVGASLNVRTHAIAQDYIAEPVRRTCAGKQAVIMWGGSLGNIEGGANHDPFPAVVRSLHNFARSLNPGDLLVLCVDTESDERKILAAYSEPSLHAQITSVIHRLKRDGHAAGCFDPNLWRHESAWFPKVGQCAHMIYPLFDQTLLVAGHRIEIPAWRRFISNNSYKFSKNTLFSAARTAKLYPAAFFQFGSIGMVVIRK